MEDIRIVKVVHGEESPEESSRWIRRLIINILVDEIGAKPKDIGRFLAKLDEEEPEREPNLENGG